MTTYPDIKGTTPLEAQHITPECRDARGPNSAWADAAELLGQVYRAQVARDPDVTITVAIYRTRKGQQ